MSLHKLKALTAFLTAQNLVDESQVDSWMEDGKLIPSSKNLGNGFLVCRFQYDALVSIERYNNDPDLLMVLVCAWLHDHDATRTDHNLAPPDIDVEILDNHSADIELRVTFREDLSLVENAAGVVPFNGHQWDVASNPMEPATEASVGNDPTIPTDKPYRLGEPE